MTVKNSVRIVFMGTPEFAVPSLKALIDAGFEIDAVVTAPDKPAGRGMKIRQSAVKKFSLEHSLRILQPENLKSPEFVQELTNIHPDLQVVVAFRMLPEAVWALPPMGTINLHASLLPQYRGAAPINHAIINGETSTGVTTFKIKHEIDTGNILMQTKVAIDERDDAGILHDKLMVAGADLIVQTVMGLKNGTLKGIDQNDLIKNTELKPAPKIHKEDTILDWYQPTRQIFNRIRGLAPYPGTSTFLKGKRIILSKAEAMTEEPTITPGDYETDGKSYLHIATMDGFIKVLRLKPEGKRDMGIEDFLRGHRNL